MTLRDCGVSWMPWDQSGSRVEYVEFLYSNFGLRFCKIVSGYWKRKQEVRWTKISYIRSENGIKDSWASSINIIHFFDTQVDPGTGLGSLARRIFLKIPVYLSSVLPIDKCQVLASPLTGPTFCIESQANTSMRLVSYSQVPKRMNAVCHFSRLVMFRERGGEFRELVEPNISSLLPKLLR